MEAIIIAGADACFVCSGIFFVTFAKFSGTGLVYYKVC